MTVEISEDLVLNLVSSPSTDEETRRQLLAALDSAYTQRLLEMETERFIEEVF